jgi:hypothetical protein
MRQDREAKPGERVFAVAFDKGKDLYVFGHGVYEGNFLPSPPAFDVEQEKAKVLEAYQKVREVTPDLPEEFTQEQALTFLLLRASEPRILLDEGINAGKTVWGYECWWGLEEVFNELAAEYTVHYKDLDEFRAEAKAESERQASMPDIGDMIASILGGQSEVN